MDSKFIILFMSIVLGGAWMTPGIAQDQNGSGSEWNFLIEPYVMFPYMNGNVGVGNLPEVSVDASAGDIFSHLQMGAMLYAEARTDEWIVGSDIIYMNLKQDVVGDREILEGRVQAKQLAWELSGLRKVLPWLDVGVGARLNRLSTEVGITISKPNEATVRNKKVRETWVDPILIARVQNSLEEKILYQFRGDLGGFGIGSDFAWQIQAYVGYRFSPLFQLTGGYRIIGVDYDKGSDSNRFMYDVDTSGFVLRFGFNL